MWIGVALWLPGAGLLAQVGGLFSYEFLNLSPSARVAALGAAHIAVADDDVNLAAVNPALLNASMHQHLSFSHAFHLAGVQHGYAAMGLYHPKWKTTFHGGIQYVDYGDFDLTNELGEVEGNFKANEYAFTLGAGRQVYERITVGANVKLISSQLETYRSLGLATDLAAFYEDTAANFSATLIFRNIGTQLSTYTDGNKEPIPFEMQAGIAKRLRHLPLRFSLIYRYLDRWNVLYDDPNNKEDNFLLNEEPTERSNSSIWLDNFFRHFVFNAELLLGARDNFRLRAGYNHLLRQELSETDYRSLSGFTFGVGLKIKRFRLDFGRTNFHIGGGVNQLSVSTHLKEFKH